MSDIRLDRRVLSDAGWWHWILTVPLLAAHLAGVSNVLLAAMVLCALFGIYFLYRIRALRPYPVQVRIAYFAWLAVGLLPGMVWMHWIALCGTT